MGLIARIDLGNIGLEDAWSVVHRTADQTGERKHAHVERLAAAEGLIFGTPCGFVADEVRPGAAKTGRTHSLVCIDHNLVLCGLSHSVEIVIYHPLVVMVVALRNHIAHIAALDCRVAVVVHKLVGLLHMPLVIAHGSGGLMMHNHLDALLRSIFLDFLYIEVRIRGHEVEDIVLHIAEPVFPAHVPAFHEHSVEPVCRSVVYVFLHISSSCSVTAVRFYLCEVVRVDMSAVQIPSVGPVAAAGYHLPPYTHIFARLDPGCVLNLARLIEVEGDAGSKYVARIVAHNHSSPRSGARALHICQVSVRIRCKVSLEHHILVIQKQMHCRIVHKGSLVEIDINTVVGLHLEGGLHTGLGENCLGKVVADST